ncbi:class I SAM-dependent methyltransferase [Luteimonas soli]|uniref:Class I SAM-dependent methyltransferase n=1 Tax=Luteimonas soli TaxID=1648966 RepID=A0ABV7XJA5_9GAMM
MKMLTRHNAESITAKIAELGPFYHNIDLPFGITTAPEHGTPARGVNWGKLLTALPNDLSGKTVLDIGCNAGAFSIEAKKRGAARVVGFDYSQKFIDQAKFCAEVLDLEIEYSVARVDDFLSASEPFDVVIFVGVLYHLEDPVGTAKLIRKVARSLCVLETVGVSPHLRAVTEGIVQFPRPKITHSGSTWINMEGLRYLFQEVAGFRGFEPLFDGSRIAVKLTK